MIKGWSNIVTFSCIVVAGIVEAVEQALKDAPKFAALFPHWLSGSFWNYVPLMFLVVGGIVWVLGQLTAKQVPREALPPEKTIGPWKLKWQKLQWANAERERLEGEVAQLKQATKQHEFEQSPACQIRDEALAEQRTASNTLSQLQSENEALKNTVTRLRQPIPEKDRPGRRYARQVFTVQRIKADEPTADPGIFCKDKIRIILTNSSDKELHLWTPLWESLDVSAHGSPLPSKLRLEGPKGWKTGDWGPEEICCKLSVGATLSCWIGLVPPTGESLERRLQTGALIGVAVFPAKIDGKLYELPVTI